MRWYKFIIYVQCFLGAILCLFNAVVVMTGMLYGERGMSELAYTLYPALRLNDIVFELLSIAIAALYVYVRFGLKDFKAKSVRLYLFLPVALEVANLIYIVVILAVLHYSLSDIPYFTMSISSSIAGCVIHFIINYIYFDHRKHLFNEA